MTLDIATAILFYTMNMCVQYHFTAMLLQNYVPIHQYVSSWNAMGNDFKIKT